MIRIKITSGQRHVAAAKEGSVCGYSEGMPRQSCSAKRRRVAGSVGLNPSFRRLRSIWAAVMGLPCVAGFGIGGHLCAFKVFDVAFMILRKIVLRECQGSFKRHPGEPVLA